jgi:hypothetical protein
MTVERRLMSRRATREPRLTHEVQVRRTASTMDVGGERKVGRGGVTSRCSREIVEFITGLSPCRLIVSDEKKGSIRALFALAEILVALTNIGLYDRWHTR